MQIYSEQVKLKSDDVENSTPESKPDLPLSESNFTSL